VAVSAKVDIRIKRVYDAPSPGDGQRVLIDRLWPRGLSRERAAVDEWARELAPSVELRRWFGHDPGRFAEFRERYRAELSAQSKRLAELRTGAQRGRVTLLFSAKDREHNDAVVLAEILGEGARATSKAGGSPRLSADSVRATASFRAALRRFERTSEQIARKHDLTPQRYLLLLMIKGAADGSQRSTVGELTERLQLAQHTVTELVGRAEHAGLIRRERGTQDARVSYLQLTPEGERRLAGAFTDHQAERRALLAALKRAG